MIGDSSVLPQNMSYQLNIEQHFSILACEKIVQSLGFNSWASVGATFNLMLDPILDNCWAKYLARLLVQL